MSVPTIFVTRLNTIVSRDTALISLSTPSGDVQQGQIRHEETLRVIMSHATMRDLAAILTKHVADLDALSSVSKEEPKISAKERAKARRQAEEEERSISVDEGAESSRVH